MFVHPKPGNSYRHPQTLALVPAEGFEADVHDLDIVRGLACGDLVAGKLPAARAASNKSGSKA